MVRVSLFQKGDDPRRSAGSPGTGCPISEPRKDPIRTRRKTGVVPKLRYLDNKETVTEEEYQIMEAEKKRRKEEEMNRRKAKEAARLAGSQYCKTPSVIPQPATPHPSTMLHSSSEQDPYVQAYFAHLKCKGATAQRKTQQQKIARETQMSDEKMMRKVAESQAKEAARLAASQYFGSLSDMPQAPLKTFMRAFFASSNQDGAEARKKPQQKKLQQSKLQQKKLQQQQKKKKQQQKILPENQCETQCRLDSHLTSTVSRTVALASAPGARQEDVLPKTVAYANAMTLLQYVRQAEGKSTLLENLTSSKSRSVNDEPRPPVDPMRLLDWDGQCSSLLSEQPSEIEPDCMKLEVGVGVGGEDADSVKSECEPLGEELSAEHIIESSKVFKAESLPDSADNSVFRPNFVCSQHEIFAGEQNQSQDRPAAKSQFPCKICREPFSDIDHLKRHMVYNCNFLQIQ